MQDVRRQKVMPWPCQMLAEQVHRIRISTLMRYAHRPRRNCFADLVKAYGVVLLLEDRCTDCRALDNIVIVAEDIRGTVKGHPS